MSTPNRWVVGALVAVLLGVMAVGASAADNGTSATKPVPTPATMGDLSVVAVGVLQEKCYRCHGPERQKGHLRVDSRAALLLGGEDGPALKPEDPEHSPLLVAVRYQDQDIQMPPDKPLADDQVAVLEAWVRSGAPWPGKDGATHAAGATGAAVVALGDGTGSGPGTHVRPPLIGRVHPLVVHFPIACLLLAVVAEALHLLVGMRQRSRGEAMAKTGWEHAVAFLIVTGAAGAVVAVATGTFFPDDGSRMFERHDATMRTHEIMGWLSMLFALSAAGYLFLAGPRASRWPLRVLLIAAAAVVGLTGHLGGAMVYGANFLF